MASVRSRLQVPLAPAPWSAARGRAGRPAGLVLLGGPGLGRRAATGLEVRCGGVALRRSPAPKGGPVHPNSIPAGVPVLVLCATLSAPGRGELALARFKESREGSLTTPGRRGRPGRPLFFLSHLQSLKASGASPRPVQSGSAGCNIETTLSGGSLGSCVDEERSQLRELM